MELHQLRYFLSVAEFGSFSTAAHSCHVSQPSLSQQIKKLEQELEVLLFVRHPHGCSLSAAGELLVEKATRLIHEEQEIKNCFLTAEQFNSRPIRIGAVHSVASSLLPSVLGATISNQEKWKFSLMEDLSKILIRKVRLGELDLAFSLQAISDPKIKSQLVGVQPLTVIASRGHASTNSQLRSLKDLKDQSFISLNRDHCLSHRVVEICSSEGFQPTINYEVACLQTVLAMVANGLGYAIVPTNLITLECEVSSLAIESPELSCEIHSYWNSSFRINEGAKSFILECHRQLKELEQGQEKIPVS